jgi:hypothetical protein
MHIGLTDYADFQAMFAALGGGPVFYHDGGGSNFQITAFTLNGTAIRVTSIGAQPGSFATDYPAAIQLNLDPSFG